MSGSAGMAPPVETRHVFELMLVGHELNQWGFYRTEKVWQGYRWYGKEPPEGTRIGVLARGSGGGLYRIDHEGHMHCKKLCQMLERGGALKERAMRELGA